MKIDKYVSERSEELNEIIFNNKRTLLVAPTESGKSTYCKNLILDNPNKRIALLCPTQALVNNLGKGSGIEYGYGSQFLSTLQSKKSIISTWDSLSSFVFENDEFDLIIIDEIHLLAPHSQFRSIPKEVLSYKKSKMVFLTGTPEVVENVPLLATNKIVLKKERNTRDYNLIETKNRPEITVREIVKDINRDNLTILRINNKEILRNIYDTYSEDYKIAIQYSEDPEIGTLMKIQSDKLNRQLRQGIIPKDIDILLATSIIDTGLSLNVKRDVDCHAIANHNSFMPNSIDMVQLAYRVRTQDGNIKLNIYGSFGFDELEESDITFKNSDVILSTMRAFYEKYSSCSPDIYKYILKMYGLIEVNHCIVKKKNIKPLSRASQSDIINNIRDCFPLHYKDINYKYHHSFGHSLKDILNPDDSFKLSGMEATAIDTLQSLNKATDRLIHLSLFMDGNFNSIKLKNLCNAQEYYKKNRVFKELIDEVIKCFLMAEFKSEIKQFGLRHNGLLKPEQDALKSVITLIFDTNRHWNRPNLKLTLNFDLEKLDYVVLYLNKFNYFNDRISSEDSNRIANKLELNNVA